MKDYLLKATAADGSIRAYISKTTGLVKEACEIHNTSLSATAALGRLLTATSLMGSMIKNPDELITVTIRGDGPIKGVVATSDYTANVKGYLFNSSGDVPLRSDGKIDVSSAIGKGTLTIIKDIGLKEPYVGQVDLVSGEIAEDITYYYAQSEQTPSAVSLGVLVDRDYSVKEAGGFIIQVLPNADMDVINILENNIKGLPPITSLLDDDKTPEEILDIILGDLSIKINEKMEIQYYCNCNKRRVEKALVSLGKNELTSIIEEDKKATLHCHFCGKDYDFSESELKKLLVKI